MKELVYLLAKYSGLFAISRWLTRNRIRVLAYHGIWMGDGHYGNRLFMSSGKFTDRMRKLAESSYPVLSLDAALARQAEGGLPSGATVITIDDGWYGSYVHMLPALERYSLPSILYVTSYYAKVQTPVFQVALGYMFNQTSATHLDGADLGLDGGRAFDLSNPEDRAAAQDQVYALATSLSEEERQSLGRRIGELLDVSYADLVDKRAFHIMTADQIAEAERRGMAIELHTHRHRVFLEGESCITEELAHNRAFLEPLIGREMHHFCYPSGVHEQSLWEEMEANGVRTATTTEAGLVTAGDPPLAMSRILDGELVSDLEFEAELAGFGEVIRRLKSLLRGA